MCLQKGVQSVRCKVFDEKKFEDILKSFCAAIKKQMN